MREEITYEEASQALWEAHRIKMNLSRIKVGTASLDEKKTRHTAKMWKLRSLLMSLNILSPGLLKMVDRTRAMTVSTISRKVKSSGVRITF